MLEELEVKCLGDECGYVTQRGLMISHTNVCAKAIVKCLNKACAKKVNPCPNVIRYKLMYQMTREELPNHRAYVCEERKMKCGTCSMLVPHSSHLVSQSSYAPADCRLIRTRPQLDPVVQVSSSALLLITD